METNSVKTKSRFTDVIPEFGLGTKHFDFEVVDIEKIDEIDGYAYVLKHLPTGGRVMWMACPDTNKSFCIGFKTPPTRSTGVFHILEHSVLCGSDSYPVKEPFVNLIKTSMNTFLNAMTYPDKTVYPVASTNERDLENLMDVYLDAVLHPAIYTNPHIFQQEGWHTELSADGKHLTYNGVVYNEMKGALSDPEEVLYEEVMSGLFPDSAYGFNSGGDPEVIPTLSYEEFIDHHKRHYSIANSYTFFYGDLDFSRQLMRLSEAFAHANPACGQPNPLEFQKPVKPELIEAKTASTSDNSCIGLGYVVGKSCDYQRMLAIQILLDALMGSNEAPLKKKLLNEGLGKDVSSMFLSPMEQPVVMLELKGASGVAEKFRDVVVDFCARSAKRGIDHNLLLGSLAQAEFDMREAEYGIPSGIFLSLQALNSWLYDDNQACTYLRYEDALADLKKKVDEGYFENLLIEIIVNNDHQALVDLTCDPDVCANKKAYELQESLGSLTDEDKEAINQSVAQLRLAQETPDSPEAVATLPQLTLEDIGDAPVEPKQYQVKAPLPCYYHEVPTHGIDYVYGYFWLDTVLWEHLPLVTIMAQLLGKLDTHKHTAEELDTWIQSNLGNLSFFTESYTDFDDDSKVRCAFVTSVATLSEKVDTIANILPEVLLHTKFDDKERIRNILNQQKIVLEQVFMSSGHSCTISRMRSYFLKSGLVGQKTSGIDYYLYICDLLENFDMRFDALRDTLTHIQHEIFAADNCEFSFTGDKDDMEFFWDKAGKLGLSNRVNPGEKLLEIPEPCIRQEGFIIPGNVCYTGHVQCSKEKDLNLSGAWTIASRALSFDYLWNEVRVKGGAYGCGFKETSTKLFCSWSYRDPNIDASLKRYAKEASWLRDWKPTELELIGYIVSSVAAMDAPKPCRIVAHLQDGLRLSNTPETRHQEVRNQLLEVTEDQIHSLADKLTQSADTDAVCVFGTRELMDASDTQLRKVELLKA